MSDRTPAPSTHFVSNAPFDPYLVEADNDKSGSHASQLRLTWWRFRRHKLALVSAILLLSAYLAITVIEFLAPYNVHTRNVDNIYATCEKLQAHGVTILRPPRDGRMAFVRSPDDISVELLQKGEALPPQAPWVDMANVGTW